MLSENELNVPAFEFSKFRSDGEMALPKFKMFVGFGLRPLMGVVGAARLGKWFHFFIEFSEFAVKFLDSRCSIHAKPRRMGTTLETFGKSCRRLRFSRLLNLYEKVEQLTVLGVDDFTVTYDVTAKHFLVSFGTRFHGFSFLKRVRLLRTRSLGRRTQTFSPFKGAAGSVTS
jgi:hypothetical protein